MTLKTYHTSIFLFLLLSLFACHESFEERVAREVAEYTHKFCPTPFINYIRTDSVTFQATSNTIIYHCTFGQLLDDKDIVESNRSKIQSMLQATIRESTSMKQYIEEGFRFRYVCRSEKSPNTILFQTDL